jgi:hypothetical protein
VEAAATSGSKRGGGLASIVGSIEKKVGTMLRIFWYTPFSIFFPGTLTKRGLHATLHTYTSQINEGHREKARKKEKECHAKKYGSTSWSGENSSTFLTSSESEIT